MKRILLVFLFVLFLCGQAWGAVIDTLYPATAFDITWTMSGCSNRYECVDDPAGSPDDWSTYLWASDALGQDNEIQRFRFDSTNISFSSVDSVVIITRAWAPNGTDSLKIGYSAWTGEIWSWIPEDTVLINAAITTFSHKFSGSWTESSINARRYGFSTMIFESGEVAYVTQQYLLVYGEEAEAPTGQVIIIH